MRPGVPDAVDAPVAEVPGDRRLPALREWQCPAAEGRHDGSGASGHVSVPGNPLALDQGCPGIPPGPMHADGPGWTAATFARSISDPGGRHHGGRASRPTRCAPTDRFTTDTSQVVGGVAVTRACLGLIRFLSCRPVPGALERDGGERMSPLPALWVHGRMNPRRAEGCRPPQSGDHSHAAPAVRFSSSTYAARQA